MLSVDTTVQSGQQQFDEQVPSRYALRIGEIEALVISDGVLLLPAETMSTNVDPVDRAVWLDDMFLPPDAFDWPLNVMMVRRGDRNILIDSGLGAEYPDFPRAGLLPQRLAAAGIDLGDLTDIIITHMHMDHVGGLLVEGIKEQLRPDLRIHVAASEVEFWKSPDFSQACMPEPIPTVLCSAATRFLNEYGSYLQTFDEECEVAPGVTIHRTGGHTAGHSVVCLESRGDRLTFAGDAIFPVGFDHPDWHNGFEHYPDESARVRVDLLKKIAATGELLVATHLPFPSVGHVAIDGDGFRWVPVIWDF